MFAVDAVQMAFPDCTEAEVRKSAENCLKYAKYRTLKHVEDATSTFHAHPPTPSSAGGRTNADAVSASVRDCYSLRNTPR